MSISDKVGILVGGAAVSEELFTCGLGNDRNMLSASALVNSEDHERVIDVHVAYLKAGVNYLVTSNYHVVPGIGFTTEEILEYTRVAGRLAVEARHRMHKEESVKICGSLPPLMPSIRSDRTVNREEGHDVYRLIGEALWPFVDLYVAESMSSLTEAKLAYDAVYHLNKPVLISFALNATGEELRSGEPIKGVIEKLLRYSNEANCLAGILFNCSQPEVVAKALYLISDEETLQTKLHERSIMSGGYADRISATSKAGQLEEEFISGAMSSQLDLEIYSSFVRRWIKCGAQIVGGCHNIPPKYIAHLTNTGLEP